MYPHPNSPRCPRILHKEPNIKLMEFSGLNFCFRFPNLRFAAFQITSNYSVRFNFELFYANLISIPASYRRDYVQF